MLPPRYLQKRKQKHVAICLKCNTVEHRILKKLRLQSEICHKTKNVTDIGISIVLCHVFRTFCASDSMFYPLTMFALQIVFMIIYDYDYDFLSMLSYIALFPCYLFFLYFMCLFFRQINSPVTQCKMKLYDKC